MDQTDTPKTPTQNDNPFLVVGIGASAGGVQALQKLFSSIPADSNMAYVVILHLSQQHESNLPAILQNQTQMPVLQVQEPTKVKPNHVYVIPPGKFLEMIDGIIRLNEPEHIEGKRVSIDHFFRTLADAYGRRAVCVILSGTGEDGTLGMKQIKERNGFAIAQDPADAAFDAMPRSAIHTGLIDVILPISKIPEKLIAVRDSTKRFHLMDDDDKKLAEEIRGAEALREIITLLRIRTGNDFSNYKQSTILRRIARHLQIHNLDNLHDYLEIIRKSPEEVEALLQNLLINVTNFFRDKEAFEILETIVIPKIFKDKNPQDIVRIWVPGCASGEEAYSIAILVIEHAQTLNDPPKVQIFASDIDEDALAEARHGLFTKSIALDVSEERLRRFFVKEGTGYRIRKEVREMILFAQHNILHDPPFSRLHLVSCRNLMIYLNRATQIKVLQLFHFALGGDGYLFLGSSESAESNSNFFIPLDKKHRIYTRISTDTILPVQTQPSMLHSWKAMEVEPTMPTYREKIFSFGELHLRLIEQYAPPSILVNEDYDIVHLSENAGRYLRYTGGEPSNNLLKVVHPDLHSDLRTALFSTRQGNLIGEVKDIKIKLGGEQRYINLTLHTIGAPESVRGFLLILFAEYSYPSSILTDNEHQLQLQLNARENTIEEVVNRLEEELQRTKYRLRNTVEQYETSLEELKASNEELQAINEELRSATEELETSKEELQSVNEELTTVNHQLKETLDEVSRTNSDLQNLMISTSIATIFLDRNLEIKRFTPEAQKLFNIIPSDTGRPLSHLTHMLEYDHLSNDGKEVLRTLQTIEREVKSMEDRWYIARLLPYRTIEDRIDGVVITFIEITGRKEAEKASLKSEKRYWDLFNAIDEGFCLVEVLFDNNNQPVNNIILQANPAFERHTGLEDPAGQPASELIPGIEQFWSELYVQVIRSGQAIRKELYSDALKRWFDVHISPVDNNSGNKVVVIFNDVTERKQADIALRESEERLRLILESIEDYAILTTNMEGTITRWNKGAVNVFGYTKEEAIGQPAAIIYTPEDRANDIPAKEMKRALETGRALDERWHMRKDGTQFFASGVMNLLQDGYMHGFVKIARDLTFQKQVEESLIDADRKKNDFLATLAHELRNPLTPIRAALKVINKSDDREQEQKAREIIERQVRKIVLLVDDLLEISRITRGKIKLNLQGMVLQEAVQNAIETTEPLMKADGHQFIINQPDEPIFLYGDKDRIEQVIINVVGNAIKYTDPPGKIELTVTKKEEQAMISIKDNGVGIPADRLESIFELFNQIEQTGKKFQTGLGIGLSLVKTLVEMHGGSIHAYSEGEGSGSEFIIRLPLASETTAATKQSVPESEQTAPEQRSIRILVVEDDLDIAEMLQAALELEGHVVQYVQTGASALQAAAAFLPEAALVDIGLPDIDGHEVAQQLRAAFPNMVLIAHSGWGSEEDIQRSREAGFDYHLVKPAELDDIVALLKKGKAS